MIHRTFSDMPSFKAMTFRPGLNIVLADKDPEATDRQTRNGAGKTSLIELFHFLLGGSCGADSLFRDPALAGHKFGMELDVAGTRIGIERSGNDPTRVIVLGNTDQWPVRPAWDMPLLEQGLLNKEWQRLLGRLIFGLPEPGETPGPKYSPTFRSLISYFARRQLAGGFLSPTQHSEKQQPWDQQVAITFLLGLDWGIPRDWQGVREREKSLKAVRKAAKQGALGPAIGSAADLRTKLTVADERSRRMRERVNSFRVLPEYHALETPGQGCRQVLVTATRLARQLSPALAQTAKLALFQTAINTFGRSSEIGRQGA